MPDLFSVPVFFIIFRETLETSIIVSVLLAFLKQTLPSPSDAPLASRMRRQIWLGTFAGSAICLVISALIVAIFYLAETDTWSSTEYYYEGAFALFASVIITVTGAALLRINKMQDKWHVKLRQAIDEGDRAKKRMKRDARGRDVAVSGSGSQGWLGRWMSRYFMFVLPFVTVLREGVEAVVFIAGVTFSAPAESVPLPVLTGLATGSFVGWLIYRYVYTRLHFSLGSCQTTANGKQHRLDFTSPAFPRRCHLHSVPRGCSPLHQGCLVL